MIIVDIAFGIPKKERKVYVEREEKYRNKLFSFMGDSITTLEGFNPPGYSVFYDSSICLRAGIGGVTDTWWGKVVDSVHGKLLVCDAWSGCRVSRLPGANGLFPSGCSNERIDALKKNGQLPDVIVIYLGTNDWAYGVPVRYSRKESADPYGCFDQSYKTMLKGIRASYPKAQVWCCTLCPTYIEKKPEFHFPFSYGGFHMGEYNKVIRRLAKRYKAGLIDFYADGVTYDSIDGTHPSALGMSSLADMCVKCLIK